MNKDKPGLILLAGGLGSRSKNPNTPKILQEMTPGVTLLDLHLKSESLFSELHFLLGFGANKVTEWIETHYKHLESKVIIHIEDTKLGTAGAIRQVNWNRFKANRYHVVLGDILTNCNYDALDSKWVESKKLGYVAVHPNLHPKDSDRVQLNESGTVMELIPKGKDLSAPNRAVAGVFGFYKRSFEQIPVGVTDISIDFLPRLITHGDLMGINTRDYFRDVGTPQRLSLAQKDFANGSFVRRSSKQAKALFIDRDGTLFSDQPKGRIQIVESELDFELVKCIIRCNELGIPVFMVTNQPAISKGWISERDVNFVHQELEMILSNLGAFIDEISFCPHHPEIGFPGEIVDLKIVCKCRKPKTGQYEKIAEFFDIDLQQSLYVGDSIVDELAARELGGKFFNWVFGRKSNPKNRLESEINNL